MFTSSPRKLAQRGTGMPERLMALEMPAAGPFSSAAYNGRAMKAQSSATAQRRLRAAIGILETHNIIFAQVSTRLHFDHHQGNLAGVGEAMLGARRQIG